MKVILFGSSLLTIPSFQFLISSNLATGICLPEGAGEHIQKLRWIANHANVPVLTVNKQNVDKKLSKWFKETQPDVAIAITFPYKIPTNLLNVPQYGCFNFHCAQLPAFAGPHPIFWEIVNGEKEGAVTVHKMSSEYDKGPIVFSLPVPIGSEDTFGFHIVQLSFMAVQAMQQLLGLLQNLGSGIPLSPQKDGTFKWRAEPVLEDLIIDWETMEASQIKALVKACNPWNKGAFAMIRQMEVRILETSIQGTLENGEPGEIVKADNEAGLEVCTKDKKALKIEMVSMEEGFLLGTRLVDLGIRIGEKFEKYGSS